MLVPYLPGEYQRATALNIWVFGHVKEGLTFGDAQLKAASAVELHKEPADMCILLA